MDKKRKGLYIACQIDLPFSDTLSSPTASQLQLSSTSSLLTGSRHLLILAWRSTWLSLPLPPHNAFPYSLSQVVPDAISLPAWSTLLPTQPQPRAHSGSRVLVVPWPMALPAEPGQSNGRCQPEYIFKLPSFLNLTELHGDSSTAEKTCAVKQATAQGGPGAFPSAENSFSSVKPPTKAQYSTT